MNQASEMSSVSEDIPDWLQGAPTSEEAEPTPSEE